MLQLVATFLVLSGIASLAYQVTWVRLLGLSMGSTSASISTVLAAFFLGLALGSYFAEKITRNRINSLTVYIYLELIIGISGIILLPVLLHLDLLVAAIPQLGSATWFKFVVTILLLCIPTASMGATFPVMASILIRQHHEVGPRMSQLYSLNTAGAVLGAALAGFVFIPNWGLDGAVYIAFAINILIVISAMVVNQRLALPPIEDSHSLVEERIDSSSIISTGSIAEKAPYRRRALIILAATGFVSIATEVGWTKYLSIFAGTTIYGFAAILTVFLIGISAGSWAIKSYMQTIRRPELWMVFGLMLLGALLLLTRGGLSLVPPVYQAINHLPEDAEIKHLVKYIVIFLLLFPATFVFGALFPLNLKLYCGNLREVRARIGKAYAVNTVASIFGSIAAGFWLIPEFGTDVLLTVMAFIILFAPLLFVTGYKHFMSKLAVPVVALLVMGSSWTLPNIDYKQLIYSVQYDNDAKNGKSPKFLFLKEGKAGVISAVTFDGTTVKLQNNGLNESFIDIKDKNNVLLVETLLGLVPYFLHDNPKSAFVVGFGGGITTGALTRTQKLEKIKVVELEPAVVEAGRAIAGGKLAALKDPRVSLEFNDARNTLLIENQSYDIIAAQPSHPWVARASNVFTQDFFQLVRRRLNKGGIYGQWVNLFNMDATTLRSIIKAFYNVFPYGMSFANLDSGDLLLFGSDHNLIFNLDVIAKRMAEPKVREVLEAKNINVPDDLFWYFALSRQEAVNAAGDIVPNTDTNIFSEVRLSSLDSDATGEESPYKFMRSNYHLSIAPYLGSKAENILYNYGIRLISWNEDRMAGFISAQLKPINEVLARGIDYELLWNKGDYEGAFALFSRHKQWPDRTYRQQALALAEYGRMREADNVVAKIADPDLRASTQAHLLYDKHSWQMLAKIKPLNDEERKWQLIGLAKQNLLSAGRQLEGIKDKVELELPQLTLLVKYYGSTNSDIMLAKYAKRLADLIDKETTRLAGLTDKAIKDKSSQRAKRLLAKLVSVNPDAADIKKYEKAIASLHGNEEQSLSKS